MKSALFLLFLLATIALLGACGVKGDPQPPETPVEMGRGKPLYKSEDEAPQSPLQRPYYKNNDQKDDQIEDDEDSQ